MESVPFSTPSFGCDLTRLKSRTALTKRTRTRKTKMRTRQLPERVVVASYMTMTTTTMTTMKMRTTTKTVNLARGESARRFVGYVMTHLRH